MVVKKLQLQNFRVYKDASFSFSPGINFITGPNGCGKTTILEALYLLSHGSSFRPDERMLIRDGADWARIEAEIGKDIYTLKITHDPYSKTIHRNSKPMRNPFLPMILFEPEQLRILHGPPDLRRQWIDQLTINRVPSHTKTLSGYSRSLRQRNSLLATGRFSKDDLFVWDVKLVEYGAAIVQERKTVIEQLKKQLAPMYQQISGSRDVVDITYQTPFEGDYASQYLRALNERLSLDRQRGFTSRGPHREDIALTLNNKPVADVASRGERRTIYLACKLIEHKLIQIDDSVASPILLLDDVFAEFDKEHKELLIRQKIGSQVFITAVDDASYNFKDSIHHIHI